MSIEPGQRMKVGVLGPGGVGGLLAGLLARQGHEVVCIAGESTCERLRADGITVRSARFGDFTVAVGASPMLVSPVDVCFVTVKATQLEAALERVQPPAVGEGVVVPFLNGIEHLAVLRQRYGNAVLPATIRVEATRVSPGQIEHASPFVTVELGLADDAPPVWADSVRALQKHLAAAGMDVETRNDELTMMWGKLCFLAPLALLTTHASAPAGVVRTTCRTELVAVIDEVSAVARAAGAHVDSASVLTLFDRLPETMQSSMQRDAAAGRSLEIEAIGGAILRAGARHHVGTPVTAKLVAELRPEDDSAEDRARTASG